MGADVKRLDTDEGSEQGSSCWVKPAGGRAVVRPYKAGKRLFGACTAYFPRAIATAIEIPAWYLVHNRYLNHNRYRIWLPEAGRITPFNVG
jgi:hypothetical protein